MLFALLWKKPVDFTRVLQLRDLRARHLAWRGKAAEQGRGHHVHPLIGALGGEDRGNEELEGVLVVQHAARVGIFRDERAGRFSLPVRPGRLHRDLIARPSALAPSRGQVPFSSL